MIKSGSREFSKNATKFLSAVSLSVLAVGTAHAQDAAAENAAAETAPAEEGDAIVRTAIDSQQTPSLTEIGTGATEIRHRRGFVCEQISQQVGQGHMVSATTATGSVTAGTGIKPISFAKEFIQFDLGRCNNRQPLSEPGFLVGTQSGDLERYSL